jgi:hypothetical protein
MVAPFVAPCYGGLVDVSYMRSMVVFFEDARNAGLDAGCVEGVPEVASGRR